MGTEVLRPHDGWNQRLDVVNPAIFPTRRYSYSNSRINRKPANRPINDRTKQRFVSSKVLSEASNIKRSSSDEFKSTKNGNSLNIGHVTILKRGESLDSTIKDVKRDINDESPVVRGTPELLGHNRLEMTLSPEGGLRSITYAGSAFALSPSPSSLPVPSFSKKKEISPILVDSATRDLRRLLRLE